MLFHYLHEINFYFYHIRRQEIHMRIWSTWKEVRKHLKTWQSKMRETGFTHRLWKSVTEQQLHLQWGQNVCDPFISICYSVCVCVYLRIRGGRSSVFVFPLHPSSLVMNQQWWKGQATASAQRDRWIFDQSSLCFLVCERERDKAQGSVQSVHHSIFHPTLPLFSPLPPSISSFTPSLSLPSQSSFPSHLLHPLLLWDPLFAHNTPHLSIHRPPF